MKERWGEKMETSTDFMLLGYKITVDCDCSYEMKRCLLLWGGGSYDKQHIKKQKYGFVDKGPYTKNSVFFFFNNHIWMSVLEHKEQWALKNLCFWTVVLDKTLESPLDSKEIKQVNPKGNQSWIFTEGLMLKLKLPYFGYLKWRANSLDKTLMLRAGREEGDRGWDDWVKSSTQWTWVWTNSG